MKAASPGSASPQRTHGQARVQRGGEGEGEGLPSCVPRAQRSVVSARPTRRRWPRRETRCRRAAQPRAPCARQRARAAQGALPLCLFPRAKGCAQGPSTACREGVAAGGTDVGVQITPGYQRASPRERDTATPPPRSPAPHTRHLPSRLCVSEPPAASTRARSAPSSALWSGVRDTPSSSRLDARSGVIG